MDRRSFLKYSVLTSASLPLSRIAGSELGGDFPETVKQRTYDQVCVFVKPLEKYSYGDIATMLSESGFDGADISFRKGGLITIDTAKTELPKLIKAFYEKKLSIPMAVSGITDPEDPDTHSALQLMRDNGIGYYRLGSINYDTHISLQENLGLLKKKMIKLSDMNAKYGIHGAIQNHVGMGFGAPVWDAYEVIKDCDPRYLGFQYDVRHAMAEGMYSWPLALEMMLDRIHTTCIKDFIWKEENGKFRPVTVPLGEGIVDFRKYFQLINKRKVSGPVSIHYEFPMLLKEDAKENVVEQIKKIIPKLRQDLEVYKNMQKQLERNNHE